MFRLSQAIRSQPWVTSQTKLYIPAWAVQRAIDESGITQKSLAERTGLSEKHISQIINGEASISTDTALLFEYALGGSAAFWINLENNYQATKARLEKASRIKSEAKLVRKYPYNELSKFDYVAETRDAAEKVENLWKFFGVNSLDFVERTEAVAYRKQNAPGIEEDALAAWLRCGEIETLKLVLETYDPSKLRDIIPELRKLVVTHKAHFFDRAQAMLASVGVALVCVPHLPHTKVHGASRWIAGNPVIQLSLRGRDLDKFWFTLFHEIGHIFKHGRKETFLEYDNVPDGEKEAEADEFAQKTLIPEKEYKEFTSRYDFSEQAIRVFAEGIETNPGIVLGRLKHDSFVDFAYLPKLHTKLDRQK